MAAGTGFHRIRGRRPLNARTGFYGRYDLFDRRTLLRAGLCAPFLPMLGAATAPQAAQVDPDTERFIRAMPKAEMHLHLEGTLEAEMKFALARRNGITLPYDNVDALRASYRFHDLPSFLAVYYSGMNVLRTQQDFHDLTYAYLAKAASQNVRHAEMFFDPQEHLKRGIPMGAVIGGITSARRLAARRLGIGSGLILCFVRDAPLDTAAAALDAAMPFRRDLIGVGLDSDEKGHPPADFAALFARARAAGLKVTMHCDLNQENTLEHLRQAIVDLKADRIDHGGNVLQSPELVAIARARGLAFTVCPGSSGRVETGGVPIDVVRGMLDEGLAVTINSDDPAYMGSRYVADAIVDTAPRSRLTRAEMVRVQRNAFNAAWIPDAQRARYLAELDRFARGAG